MTEKANWRRVIACRNSGVRIEKVTFEWIRVILSLESDTPLISGSKSSVWNAGEMCVLRGDKKNLWGKSNRLFELRRKYRKSDFEWLRIILSQKVIHLQSQVAKAVCGMQVKCEFWEVIEKAYGSNCDSTFSRFCEC